MKGDELKSDEFDAEADFVHVRELTSSGFKVERVISFNH